MLLRLCYTTRRYCHHLFPHHHRHHNPARLFSSSTSRNPDEPPNNLKNSDQIPHPPSVLHRHLNPLYSVPGASSLPRAAAIALSGTLASALMALYVVVSTDCDDKSLNPVHNGVRHAVLKSTESFRKLLHHAKQTGVASSVLWHSLSSILSFANHEVRSGFELRVAAFLTDIAAANASRRVALVGAGGGAVVDWLLESVAVPRDGCGSQAESARALAFLISDPNVSAPVLGRPGAVPNLFRFIFSCQPHPSKKEMFGPSNPGVSYAKYLEGLAAHSAPLFLCHFYNIYISHIAGGQVIARQVSEKLLEGRELGFYTWEGDVQELLKGVREKLNKLGEHWTRDDKNKCLKETTKSFRYLGQTVRLIILEPK